MGMALASLSQPGSSLTPYQLRALQDSIAESGGSVHVVPTDTYGSQDEGSFNDPSLYGGDPSWSANQRPYWNGSAWATRDGSPWVGPMPPPPQAVSNVFGDANTGIGRLTEGGILLGGGAVLSGLGSGGAGAGSGAGTEAGTGIGEGSASTAATGVTPAATAGIGGGGTGLAAGVSGDAAPAVLNMGNAGLTAADTFGGSGAVTGGVGGINAGTGAATGAAGSGAGAGAGTAMSRILDGTASTADWLSVGGNIAGTGLGVAGARNQANAYNNLANQYMAFGAPSRARYEASMSPGFDPNSIPGYSGAVDTASKGILARLSATGGNPWGNPGGLIEANKQIISGTALPAIDAYQRLNAGTGGYAGFNAAAPAAATAGIGANAGVYNAVGSGLAGLLNPQPSLYDTLRGLGVQGLS